MAKCLNWWQIFYIVLNQISVVVKGAITWKKPLNLPIQKRAAFDVILSWFDIISHYSIFSVLQVLVHIFFVPIMTPVNRNWSDNRVPIFFRVGDPFKDTAGPSIHVLIKMLATITLVMAPVFLWANSNIWYTSTRTLSNASHTVLSFWRHFVRSVSFF